MSDDTPPDLIGAVAGYRSFRLGLDEVGRQTLYSAGVFPTPWPPGTVRAACGHGLSHKAPARRGVCTCGLYGYHSPLSLSGSYVPHSLLGLIRAWGIIEVYPAGFRAEFAEIMAWGPYKPFFPSNAEISVNLQRRYGPAISFPNTPGISEARELLEAQAERLGLQPILESLRPSSTSPSELDGLAHIAGRVGGTTLTIGPAVSRGIPPPRKGKLGFVRRLGASKRFDPSSWRVFR